MSQRYCYPTTATPATANPTVHFASTGEWGHGRVIVPYTGPTPPEGTHRYIFLLYRNPKDMPLGAVGPQVSFLVAADTHDQNIHTVASHFIVRSVVL